MSESLPPLPLGEYEHNKGGRYQLLGVARHSETLEPLVVYQALYGDRSIWVRPAVRFTETVVFDSVENPRFRRVGN